MPDRFLKELLEKISSRFSFIEDPEIAIEVDPNLMSLNRFIEFKNMGFNRVSIGLQDFNKNVLNGVNRGFPGISPKEYIAHAKSLGYKGINLDLIYGLPRQTPETFRDTLLQTIDASPDRIAIFSYAHVPSVLPHQMALEKLGLASPEAKLEMAVDTHNILTSNGYVAIGMDHFAKPGDDLALALKAKQLHRNFQGYCTKRTTGQVYAFGVSAISQLESGYGQNVKDTGEYIQRINSNTMPIQKIYLMTNDDLFYKEVINSLMCNGELVFSDLAQKFKMDLPQVMTKISTGIEGLSQYIDDGLVEVDSTSIKVTQSGWLVVRCVAMLFDPLLKKTENNYSRTV